VDRRRVYWIPANGDDVDPTTQMSILYDNRSRIALRVRQLKHDKRHAQNPKSRLRRIVGNVEVLDIGDDVVVGANFIVYESRERGRRSGWAHRVPPPPGRRRVAPGRKKVMLVDNDRPCRPWPSSSDGGEAVDPSAWWQRVRLRGRHRRPRRAQPRLRLEDLRTGRVGYLDALELETLAWLPDGGLHRLLDPSHVRWPAE